MKLNWSNIGISLSTIAVLTAWGFSYSITQNRKVEKINYSIESVEGAINLISEKEVKKMVDAVYNIDIMTLPIVDLDVTSLENTLQKDNRIYRSEVYVDAKKQLNINIKQRLPIVRIIDKTGIQYYLDQEGNYISKQDYKAIRVPVATGDIEAFDDDWRIQSGSKIKECFDIVNALRKDDFLTALVEQIHFEDQRIIMVPKMSSELIVIKHLDFLDQKLNNLKRFYQTEMTKNNSWGKFKEIDISYKNQVITRPVNP